MTEANNGSDVEHSSFKKIVLASRNQGKIKEFETMLGDLGIELLSLNDYPDIPEIVEDGKSFSENALKKARTVAEATGETVLADDSGLEVDALGGAPGIYSARYAGEGTNDERNIRKLLDDLKDIPPSQRKAAFRCVLILYRPGGEHEIFDGCCEGLIAETPAGLGGFGYDPVFLLPDRGITVAELLPEIKNQISHRAKALAKMKDWLCKRLGKKNITTGRSAAR